MCFSLRRWICFNACRVKGQTHITLGHQLMQSGSTTPLRRKRCRNCITFLLDRAARECVSGEVWYFAREAASVRVVLIMLLVFDLRYPFDISAEPLGEGFARGGIVPSDAHAVEETPEYQMTKRQRNQVKRKQLVSQMTCCCLALHCNRSICRCRCRSASCMQPILLSVTALDVATVCTGRKGGREKGGRICAESQGRLCGVP